jgi:hypothetical protein
MVRISSAAALLGAAALLFGTAQVRADVVSPCIDTFVPSDCLWLGDATGKSLDIPGTVAIRFAPRSSPHVARSIRSEAVIGSQHCPSFRRSRHIARR